MHQKKLLQASKVSENSNYERAKPVNFFHRKLQKYNWIMRKKTQSDSERFKK